MKSVKLVLFLLLIINKTFGQISIDQHFIDNIELGYTTRSDIEKLLGPGEYLTKQILNPDYEQELGISGWVHYNGLLYSSSGLTFTCERDGELISGIQFKKPYRGKFNNETFITVGQTKIGDAFPHIDTFKVSTTIASNYWSFQFDKFSVYIKKTDEDKKNYYFNSYDKNTFKDKLQYYKNQTISIVTISIYDHEYLKNEKIYKGDNLYCLKPLYAPKSETNLNCYKMVWPVFFLFIPLYAMTGGGKSKIIKHGYWKEFSPNHIINSEGQYNNGRKNGIFKYYKINGKLIRTENNSSIF